MNHGGGIPLPGVRLYAAPNGQTVWCSLKQLLLSGRRLRLRRRRTTPSVPNDHLRRAVDRLKKGKKWRAKNHEARVRPPLRQGCRFSGRDRECLPARPSFAASSSSLACVSAYRCPSSCQSILPGRPSPATACPPARLPPIIKCLVWWAAERESRAVVLYLSLPPSLPPLAPD